MKTPFHVILALGSVLILNQTALAHGEIEKIECQNKQEKVTLTGVSSGEHNQLNITLKRGDETWTFDKVALQLEDQVKKDQVIERIRFQLKSRAEAELFIREVPEEKRTGTGQLSWKDPKYAAAPLSCTVIY